jgi:hypothetical protein
MWRLRRKTERGWNDGFHINTKAEAEGLCELLNKLERELDDYRNLAFQSESKLEEAQQQLLVKRSNNRRLDARNKRLESELTETCKRYETACETAAKMHAAAVGEIKGPHIDPVQDILDLRRERDEWKAKFIQQNKDLGCEMMDPAGSIWDYACGLQRENVQLKREVINWKTAHDIAIEQRDRAQDAIEMMLKDSACRRIPAYTKEQLTAVKGGKDE